MLKKIAAALLAAMMALSLTACSGGDEKQRATPARHTSRRSSPPVRSW